MKWIVNDEKTIFRLKDSSLDIYIHKIRGLEGLYLTCNPLRIKDFDLKTEDFSKAVMKAQFTVMLEADKIYQSALNFAESNYTQNEFVKH